MYGKFFESTFTGSMLGAGANVFSVWGYIIAHCQADSRVEINPKLVAVVIGTDEKSVADALVYLSSPDPNSRSKIKEGRRIIQESEYTWLVVNHESYRSIKNSEELRKYNREKQRESRQRRMSSVKNDQVKCQDNTDSREHTTDNKLTTTTPPAAAEKMSPEELRDLWNTFCKSSKLRSCRSLTPDRKKSAISRIKELTKEEIEESIKRIAASSFCNGNNDRGWVADFDFLLRPSSMAKALEGVYDQRQRAPSRGRGGMPIPDPNEEA